MGLPGDSQTTPRNRPRSSSRCHMKKSDSSEMARDNRLIDRFLEMMSAERGAAQNTLAAYQRDLSAYAAFLYATGLRVSELISLKRQAIAKGPQFIVVKGKGGRERMVPVSQKAGAAVQAYLGALSKERDDDTPWLFPSHGHGGYLTRQHFAL